MRSREILMSFDDVILIMILNSISGGIELFDVLSTLIYFGKLCTESN